MHIGKELGVLLRESGDGFGIGVINLGAVNDSSVRPTTGAFIFAFQSMFLSPTLTPMKQLLATALFVFLAVSPSSAGDLEDGIAAYWADDYDRAFVLLLPLAEDGNAEAEYHVGQMYLLGLGREQDLVLAVEWFDRAANQGHVRASFKLGAYYKGSFDGGSSSPSRNFEKAEVLLTFASNKCDTDAMALLGVLYATARAPDQNLELAFGWLYVATAYGSSEGEQALGAMLTYHGADASAPGKLAAQRIKDELDCPLP